jgi:hypothetical protein
MSTERPGLADIDLVELGEMLEFLHDLVASNPDVIADVLERFIGGDGYSLDELRADLARFAFLLGGDGERLFGNQQ